VNSIAFVRKVPMTKVLASALALLAASLASSMSGQAIPPGPLVHLVKSKEATLAAGVACNHFAAVCGGTYVRVASGCPSPDVYDLTVPAGVHLYINAMGDPAYPPSEVSIEGPSGSGASGSFLLEYTTTEPGVHTIRVYSEQPLYSMNVNCAPVQTCSPSATILCLNDGRFSVTTAWRTASGEGAGTAVPLTVDTGYFWFFSPQNVEIVTKVLNACADPANRYWVFAGGLTDVEVEITVLDTLTGVVNVYRNPEGTAFAPVQDTATFSTCP
jgi:hypothetical protein